MFSTSSQTSQKTMSEFTENSQNFIQCQPKYGVLTPVKSKENSVLLSRNFFFLNNGLLTKPYNQTLKDKVLY